MRGLVGIMALNYSGVGKAGRGWLTECWSGTRTLNFPLSFSRWWSQGWSHPASIILVMITTLHLPIPQIKQKSFQSEGKCSLIPFRIWNAVMHVEPRLYPQLRSLMPIFLCRLCVPCLPCWRSSAPFLDNGWQLKFCCGAEIMFCGEECRLLAPHSASHAPKQTEFV